MVYAGAHKLDALLVTTGMALRAHVLKNIEILTDAGSTEIRQRPPRWWGGNRQRGEPAGKGVAATHRRSNI